MRQSTPTANQSAVPTESVDIPSEFRVVCADCGADGGTYSFSVPHSEPSHCPWCGHAVDGDVTRVVAGCEESTGLSEGESL